MCFQTPYFFEITSQNAPLWPEIFLFKNNLTINNYSSRKRDVYVL
uniref:Uncharacterized protein n=1 Tax=Heterorhabditis bacteriophora TaxID=37862 RepID=A0A1I7W621_HETBA